MTYRIVTLQEKPHIHLHYVTQGTQEWHDAREGMYTGSNAYKLLGSIGVHEYAKAVQTEFKGNFWTKRGHILEDESIELYEAIKGVKVDRPGFVTNDKYPGCLYSPDGWPPVPLLESKSFDLPQHMKLINGDIDWKILAQIHYGLVITEKPYAELLPYNPNESLAVVNQFKIIKIPINQAIQNNFKRILKG